MFNLDNNTLNVTNIEYALYCINNSKGYKIAIYDENQEKSVFSLNNISAIKSAQTVNLYTKNIPDQLLNNASI